MISQADILKTLINNNCTDESVMSTALSSDCTPPKLMEKLMEAERFDLALDISMKLGLDVMPLWRTWAIRCLKNRNFQGARDKFKHCFQRLRLPGGRTSPVQNKLLADILDELKRMDEVQLSLVEEIELIKRRRRPDLGREDPSTADNESNESQDDLSNDENHISSKPTIYAECLHYLTNYGGPQDKVRFFVINSIWEEAVKILLEKSNQINLDKFFVGEVFLFAMTTGQLSYLVSEFLKTDPGLVQSTKYLKAMYNFCLKNRRYHVLYYIQSSIGDYIGAAAIQINYFFLKKPVQSYRELNQRVPNLVLARKNYQDYLEKLDSSAGAQETFTKTNSSLFTSMKVDEVHAKIKLIDSQIDITRNFAINEVSGCVNGIDLGVESPSDKTPVTDDSPVTLFELDVRRKTFLAALILIYFDLSCSSYFSKNGLELSNELINDFKLDKLRVFKTAMRILIDDESCDILENASLLLDRIKEDYLENLKNKRKQPDKRQSKSSKSSPSSSAIKTGKSSTGKAVSFEPPKNHSISQTTEVQIRAICDEVIKDSIGSCNEPDYKMELAKLLSPEAKIELYIEHGKLSNAQRLAFNMNRPDYVTSIIEEASRLNQDHVKTVCQLWLAKHETKNPLR